MKEGPTAVKQHAALFAFLRHYHPEIPPVLLQALPSSERHDPADAQLDLEAFLASISTVIAPLHYSWLLEAIQKDGPQMAALWSASLPSQFSERVAAHFGFSGPFPKLPEPVTRFLLETLYQRIGLDQVLPVALLPPSPFNRLLTLEKRVLVRMIDFLGLYDVVALLRRTVIPALGQRVRQLLTESQNLELERALQSQDLLPPPPIDLAQWTDNSDRFNRLLQVQGLTRLGKIMARANPSLVWHIAHQLDTGRGKMLLRQSEHPVEAVLEKRLVNQLDSLLDRLTR